MSWPPKPNCSFVRMQKGRVNQRKEKLVFSDTVWEERKTEDSMIFLKFIYIHTFKTELLFKGNIEQFSLLCLTKVQLWKSNSGFPLNLYC